MIYKRLIDIIYNSGHEFFQGYETGVKTRFFSLFPGVFLGLGKTTLFVTVRCDSGLIFGSNPCSTIWNVFRESRGASKREYGDFRQKTAKDVS